MTPFSAGPAGYQAEWEPVERQVVASLAVDLAALIKVQTGLPDHFDDPVARLISQSTGLGGEVTDPGVGRLFPDALPDDAAAAAEFRRLTQNDLAAGQVHSLVLLAAIASGEGKQVVVPRDQAQTVASALTALRLVLAQRLGLETDDDVEALHQAFTAPRAARDRKRRPEPVEGPLADNAVAGAFLALGFAQETLLDAMLAEYRGNRAG